MEQQVQLMHQQHEAYLTDRDERDAPVFTCTPKGYAGEICEITITMDSGPQEVTVRIPEIRVRPEGHDPTYTDSVLTADNHEHRVVPGGDISVNVDLRADNSPVTVELRLECTEQGERRRSWTRRKSVPVPGPRRRTVRKITVGR